MIGSLGVELKKAIDRIVEAKAGTSLAAPAPVDAVLEDGSVMLRVNGRSVAATMATEEPILAGETVWTAQTQDGRHIVHGSGAG